jgi:hypothetical protein
MLKPMRIQSTSDVSLAALREAAQSLPSAWNAAVDDEQMFFRSMDVPSWVSVVAEAPWWLQAFAAGVSVYVSGIISEAGKDTWRSRSQIAATIRSVPSAISQFADFLVAAQSAGTERTFVVLAIPFPDEYNTAHLRVSYSTQEELEFSVALFVHHIPALERLWIQEGIQERASGGITLELGDDCSLLVAWMDRAADVHEHVVPFGDEL